MDRGSFGTTEFHALLNGEVACVVIDDFSSEAVCHAIGENVVRLGFARSYTGDNLEASFTGLAAMEYLGRQEDYLTAVAEANAERRQLLGSQPDPIEDVVQLLRAAWPAGARIATEGDRAYFAGVIRSLKKVPHHTDSARRDLEGWSVAKITRQLSWNLFLTDPDSGGEFEIWSRYWRDDDERDYRYDRATKKGYRPEVVHGHSSVVVSPCTGRLVLFNALYYHTVRDVIGAKPRLAMSSFIGVIDEDSPVALWS
jgi:hypothetical protein